MGPGDLDHANADPLIRRAMAQIVLKRTGESVRNGEKNGAWLVEVYVRYFTSGQEVQFVREAVGRIGKNGGWWEAQ